MCLLLGHKVLKSWLLHALQQILSTEGMHLLLNQAVQSPSCLPTREGPCSSRQGHMHAARHASLSAHVGSSCSPGMQTAEEDAGYLGEVQSQVEQLQAGDAGDSAALRGIEAWPQPA